MSSISAFPSPRFVSALLSCPLCADTAIEYEFVVAGRAFSRCSSCTLLFANPPGGTSGERAGALETPVRDLISQFARRYLGRDVDRVLLIEGEERRILAGDAVGPFDLVIAHGFVERSVDPLESLGTLRSLVAPDGALALITPSSLSPAARESQEAWPPLRYASWVVTVDTAQLALTRSGFGAFASIVDPRDAGDATERSIAEFFRSNIVLLARPRSAEPGRRLTVVVPVFNEITTVRDLLDTVLSKTIPNVDIDLIIVESNSTDGSRDAVLEYADNPRVTVLLEPGPRGKGYAVRTGLEKATGDVVLIQDADLEYDVNDYDALVEPLFALQRNFVLGSRKSGTGEAWKIRHFETRPLISMVMNFAHAALLTMYNRLYGQRLTDPFTMYKVFRRDCLHGLFFTCDRFDFDYELGIKLIRKGYTPYEIPVNYQSRSFDEGKKVRFFADPPTWIRAMLRLRRSPLYRFGP